MQLRLWLSLAIGILISFLWNETVLLPVKLLVVYVHEIGHGFSAMASGAYLEKINLSSTQWGETLVKELNPGTGFFVTVSSGYLGSILAGTILFNRGLTGKLERFTLLVFLMILFYTGFLFTDTGSISFFTALGWALFLLIPVLLGQIPSRLTILALGVFFIWYCFFDLFDFTRDITQTDAGILARYILENEIWFSRNSSEKHVAQIISSIWSIGIVFILAAGILPELMKHSRTINTVQDPSQELNQTEIVDEQIPMDQGIIAQEKAVAHTSPAHSNQINDGVSASTEQTPGFI